MADMRKSLITPGDVATALALLTRLPVRASFERGAAAAWAWPIAGAIVASFAALTAYIGLALGLPAILIAVAVVGVQIAFTGGLHEDGLADVADGFWGGADKARRLEIMKDSRVGTYGVLALVLSVLARVAALGLLIPHAPLFSVLVTIAMMSRVPMAVLMAVLPNARGTSGLSASVGKPPKATVVVAAGLAVVLSFVIFGFQALIPIPWIVFSTLGLAAVAKAKIGGQTGDVLGTSQQLAEIVALAALCAYWS